MVLPVNHHATIVQPGTGVPGPRSVARVLIVGLGNIGSILAVLVAPHVAFMRLVDRDIIEGRNSSNQLYGPGDVGRNKVDATADRIQQLAPNIPIDRRKTDLADLPWGEYSDVDIILAGLDSLAASQLLSERVFPLGIPWIDGAVGDSLTRVQVLLPGAACLECCWSDAHYRTLTAETPCLPGGSPSGPRTMASGCVGAATAAFMVAQLQTLLGPNPPAQSYEINGDLQAGYCIQSRRQRNARCRFHHDVVTRWIGTEEPFAAATVGCLLATLQQHYGRQPVQLEFRRGIIDDEFFGSSRFVSAELLQRMPHRRLADLGLTARDRIAVRVAGQATLTHICLDSTQGALS
jgi:molybdopterin/thiamine biosynthesis adenylyltransferase